MKNYYPGDSAEREWKAPVLRIVSVLLALAVAAGCFMPLGFACIETVAPYLKIAQVPVWVGLISIAVYSVATRKPERGKVAALVLWMIVLLNLGGCVFVLGGIGRATSG